jgi:hypothetical protein
VFWAGFYKGSEAMERNLPPNVDKISHRVLLEATRLPFVRPKNNTKQHMVAEIKKLGLSLEIANKLVGENVTDDLFNNTLKSCFVNRIIELKKGYRDLSLSNQLCTSLGLEKWEPERYFVKELMQIKSRISAYREKATN